MRPAGRPVHWTYRPIDADDGDLEQGDIIQLSDDLRSVFSEVHPHFTSDKYIAFLVLTQTCDIARRNGEGCRSRYINLAVVRPLADVLATFLDRLCDKVEIGNPPIRGIYVLETKSKAQTLMQRVFNQNAQTEGMFYLHPDAGVGISEHSVALLQVSFAVRAHEHYAKLVGARSGRLSEQFQSKLGWLIGHLFSRVATRDWEPNQISQMTAEFLEGSSVPQCEFRWVPRLKAKEAQKRETELIGMTAEEAAAFIKQLKGRQKEQAIAAVLDAVREILPGVSPDQLNALQAHLDTDSVFSAACK